MTRDSAEFSTAFLLGLVGGALAALVLRAGGGREALVRRLP